MANREIFTLDIYLFNIKIIVMLGQELINRIFSKNNFKDYKIIRTLIKNYKESYVQNDILDIAGRFYISEY